MNLPNRKLRLAPEFRLETHRRGGEMIPTDDALIELIREQAHPLIGTMSDHSPLIEVIGDKSIVLLGEATHGTHEFYRARFEITKRLVEEKGFTAVVLEADWPDCRALNRHIHRADSDSESDALEALTPFQRFPMWMWRNTEFLEMVQWLWMHNRKERTPFPVSVYGMDMYSLYSSIHEVITYLEKVDAEAADRARRLYSCFDHNEMDPTIYGHHVRIGSRPSCEDEAIQALEDLLEMKSEALPSPAGTVPSDELFYAQQNAEVIKNAEIYYRNLFNPLVNTWNIRDRHMADTIENLIQHLESHGRPAKIVIWAHNSHIGDSRATEMGRRGQWNVGQLLRERHPNQTFHLGFTTYSGNVQAASRWDHPPESKKVRPALVDSFEYLFHQTDMPAFLLPLKDPTLRRAFSDERLERAIGVIYSPDTERISHYFYARLAEQFDAVIHIDESNEVQPLDRAPRPEVAPPSEIQL